MTSTLILPKARLVERRDVTEDLMVMKLEPERQPYTFKPGQYCTLGLKGVERAYSIVSAPHEGFLEVFVELVPEGGLTPLMWDMKLGDEMSLRPTAKGIFTLDRRRRHHFMLATVTGVAPYISMVRSYANNPEPGHEFYVLMGASYDDEFTYDGELQELSQRFPDAIHFVPTVSRPNEERNAAWTGVKGRVNAIAEEFLQHFDLPQESTMVYACGHPGMIEDVRDKLPAKGWKLKEERFWKE